MDYYICVTLKKVVEGNDGVNTTHPLDYEIKTVQFTYFCYLDNYQKKARYSYRAMEQLVIRGIPATKNLKKRYEEAWPEILKDVQIGLITFGAHALSVAN